MVNASLKNPDGAFDAKWTRFAWEARHFLNLTRIAAGQDAPAATGARLCKNRKA
jgi:hypothetical protein